MTAMRIYSILWTVFGLVWLAAWTRTKRTQERAAFSSRLLYAIPVSIGSYLMVSHNIQLGWLQSRVLPGNIMIDGLGITLTAAGIALAIWARFYLGQNWSGPVSIKVGHELIRTGPYAGYVIQFIPGSYWRSSGLPLDNEDQSDCLRSLCFGWSLSRLR